VKANFGTASFLATSFLESATRTSARTGVGCPFSTFALGLEHAARELLHGKEEAEFEFTESDSAIRFQRDEGDVFISASYAPHRTVVNLDDLVKAVRLFRKRVVDDLSLSHRELRMNSTMRNLMEGTLDKDQRAFVVIRGVFDAYRRYEGPLPADPALQEVLKKGNSRFGHLNFARFRLRIENIEFVTPVNN
jgi:hypothetical protein